MYLLYLSFGIQLLLMNIKTQTLSAFINAVNQIGEEGMNDVLYLISSTQQMIDDIADIICCKTDLNKTLLFIKKRPDPKKELTIYALIHFLKKNGVMVQDIEKYFGYKHGGIRVNKIYQETLELNELIPMHKELIKVIDSVGNKVEKIFNKYYFNITNSKNN